MLALAEYYGLDQDTEFVNSTDLNVAGKGSQRVLDIVQAIGGNTYVTGHGAGNISIMIFLKRRVWKSHIWIISVEHIRRGMVISRHMFQPWI